MVLIARILAATPRPVWWVVAALAALMTAYTFGAVNNAREGKAVNREEYHDTLEKIDGTLGHSDGAGGARDRLRDTFGPWPSDL